MSHEVDVGLADLQSGEMRSVEVGRRVVLVARDGAAFYALDDWCNHAGCLLSEGKLRQHQVICPCHDVGFRLADGKRMGAGAAICDDQPTFPIQERDGHLFVTVDDLG